MEQKSSIKIASLLMSIVAFCKIVALHYKNMSNKRLALKGHKAQVMYYTIINSLFILISINTKLVISSNEE